MSDTAWSSTRSSAKTLPPLLVMLVGAHLLNPVFGLAIAERETFHELVLDPVVCGGFGLLCAQSTLLGLWAALHSGRLLRRLAPTMLLLALAAIAPTVLHGSFVTVRFVLLPFLGMLLLTPLRWWGLRLERPEQPSGETRGKIQFTLLQLQCIMVGVAVMVGLNGPALFSERYELNRLSFQLAGFSVAYTLLLAVVVCTDSTRSRADWFRRAAGFLALAALPYYEAFTFQSRPDFELLWRNVFLPLHAAQCVVVLLSLLVLHTAGYRLLRLSRRERRAMVPALPATQPAAEPELPEASLPAQA